MRTIPVVVAHEFGEHRTQVLLVQHDDVVEALSPKCPDDAFSNRVRMRRPNGRDFRQRARRIGVDAIATPVASPRANAVIERVIGTLRRECLDHLIILDERYLRSVLDEFVHYYNLERPHRTLRLETPVPHTPVS